MNVTVNKYNVVGFATGMVVPLPVDIAAGILVPSMTKNKNAKSFAKGMLVAGAVGIVTIGAILVTGIIFAGATVVQAPANLVYKAVAR